MNWLVDKLREIRRKEMDNIIRQAEIPAEPEKPPVEPKKPRKPRAKKKKVAPPKEEPRVDVLKFDFDPANPRMGSIELDWNDSFVELLQKHGYSGATDEDIVDTWLNDVCRNIVANEYQGANMPKITPSANLVNKKPLGDGKIEIS